MPRVLSRPHATQKGTGRINAGHCPAMSPPAIAAPTWDKCGTLSRHVPQNDRVTVRDKWGTLSRRVPQRRRAPAVSGFHLSPCCIVIEHLAPIDRCSEPNQPGFKPTRKGPTLLRRRCRHQAIRLAGPGRRAVGCPQGRRGTPLEFHISVTLGGGETVPPETVDAIDELRPERAKNCASKRDRGSACRRPVRRPFSAAIPPASE